MEQATPNSLPATDYPLPPALVEQGQPTHGSLPEHYLAWRGRVRALHPVQSLLDVTVGQAGVTEVAAKVNEPFRLTPDSPFVSGQARTRTRTQTRTRTRTRTPNPFPYQVVAAPLP